MDDKILVTAHNPADTLLYLTGEIDLKEFNKRVYGK
jgi:hypothetical protein